MSKAGSKGMAGMVMAIPIFVYSTEPPSHTSKGLAISMHTATFVELCSFVSTGEHGLLLSCWH